MRPRTVVTTVASIASLALVATIAAVWPGLDAHDTPLADTSVWAMQTGDGRRYARVNTTVGELDTVRAVSNPSQIVQTSDAAYLFSDSYSKVTAIDEALPTDLDEETLKASPSTPPGTVDVETAGDFVAYRTDAGAVYVGLLSQGTPQAVEPFRTDDDEDAVSYTADAIAVNGDGTLFAYSSQDDSVLTYDISDGSVRERDDLTADLGTPAVTAAGDAWVVVDAEDGELWRRGSDAAGTAGTTGTVVVGRADADADAVYLADETMLVRVPADGSDISTAVGGGSAVLGSPAAPIVRDGVVYAAWVAGETGGGVLWTSDGGQVALDYNGESLGDVRRPVFVATDEAVILNEMRSGWVWTVPDGALVASSQDWSLDDRTDPESVPSDEQLAVVIDPKPPIAEPDTFGVRPGALVSLAVLLNDHDPNEDVLSIDPTSVTGLDPGFGTLSLTEDQQQLAIRVDPEATGTATFSYAVTDGTTDDGLISNSTTVTLTTVGAESSAPVWCGVESCLAEWPTPEVSPGGTVTVPVLNGWVDPEGDPLFLLSVDNASDVGSVAASPSGEVVFQHSDDGGGAEQVVQLDVTVSDSTGQTVTKPLIVRISSQPQLSVQSFALVDTIDASLTVDVAPHVTGTAGTLAVTSVRVLDDADASATIIEGATTFDFAPNDPGIYRVDFTVTDGLSEASGTARITVLEASAPAQLATAPVVAFVRPQEDATIDVFSAVSNPTRRVLLLSDVTARAADGSSLSVDSVAQNYLRVTGTTETGESGLLGTVDYTVSDGTDDTGSRVEGEAVVYLLPEAPDLAPIAVDDSVVVRAGEQIDIPVRENDISPAGGLPILDPSTVSSSTPDALAFASGGVLRYLAPEEPGDYTIDYSVYTQGAPSLVDTAKVRVRVVPSDVNRAPRPETLEGRVLAGQSTAISFDGFGMDPDGDVVTLKSVVTQPESGVATISADGESIEYSSVSGFRGQVSFRYRVTDAAGSTGEGTVRIGVLDGESNPSPITFTDYVQVQAGEDSTIRVSPLANDIDPTMKRLSLTAVRPDLPERLSDGSVNAEYGRRDAHIGALTDTTVVIEAGTEPGTMSFLYDVESASGNTGRGLIVVKVVRESVPDYPVVADTVLTVQNRDDFIDGVNVIDGRATWSSGDLDDATISLWRDSDSDVNVDGDQLSGQLPARTRVIPFAVTAETASGEVQTYAFLRVPGDDDLSLSLKSSVPPQEVNELESVSFDMTDLVAVPAQQEIEVGKDIAASGARAEASCQADGGTSVRYDAGAGGPWTDACQVAVRLVGQEEWTYLSVPITVIAADPQPILSPASITAGPGETVTFDLKNMTTWQLRDDWAGIEYAISGGSAQFEVSLDGSIVTITGVDTAVPGSEAAVVVTVPSHEGVAPARLLLRVGAAPSTLPQGGSLTQTCSQAAGSSCTISVIGASGEVNPLPGTPLEVVGVRTTGACVGVSFAVSSTSAVTASWSQDAPGATCSAAFTVRDAQGRQTSAERDGRILLDLQGYPKAPASVRQASYDNGSLTLAVDPGAAREAYPALTGFTIRSNGQVVAQCSTAGACPAISAPNGERRTYEAWAVNSVGESKSSVQATAWAYKTPATPSQISASPVVTPDGTGGVVSLTIGQVESAETGSLVISSAAGDTITVNVGPNQRSVQVPSFRVGANVSTAITVTPVSRFDLPPGLDGVTSGAAATAYGNGVGAPTNPRLSLSSSSNGDGTSKVSAEVVGDSGGEGSTMRYGIVPEGQDCRPNSGGNTASFDRLEDGREYTFVACIASIVDGRSFGTTQTTKSVRAIQSGFAPTGYTFVVNGAPQVNGNTARWTITEQPTSNESVPRNNRVEFSGWPSNSTFDQNPGIQVRYVHTFWNTSTPYSNVSARAGSAPYQTQASWGATCTQGAPLSTTSQSSNGLAAITFDPAALVYYDADNAVVPHEAGTWDVPAGAVRVDGIRVTVDWSAQGWNLSPASQNFSVTCAP
ncbi:hypothetical protein FHX48_002004 [Microbacterium halimionae]|uniref:Tandem-95 repeat protein n=1 Tax=Microbacterium halimionae TaxID=1526413 RepID=A0A7W3PMB8_9MICO|nr:Ig-like domain-containing protein [Microbacterium halimionae]MBA8816911.1 hypothetical protein [Microbacterium halimionae]NII94793.1 hypothetical protein [Microbacterium halimionae]